MHYFIDLQIFFRRKKCYLIKFCCCSWIYSVISTVTHSQMELLWMEKDGILGPQSFGLAPTASRELWDASNK